MTRNEYNMKIEDRKLQGRDQLDQFKKTNRLFWYTDII